jgi:single-stranded-DNA-specific exonuclease
MPTEAPAPVTDDPASGTPDPAPPSPELVWNVQAPDEDAVRRIAAELELPPLVARLMVNRGVDSPEAARLFLNPRLADLHDPACLPDVDKAVDRLARALETGERIFVHGDYDVDGVTSAALCLRALSALGANVVGYVPRRADGYDLQKVGVDKAKAEGATLIFTADCGVCAVEPVKYANELGIDVIVTDHHRPDEELPPAVAVVNPYRSDCAPPFRELCGAGVAFKVLDALVERVAPAHRNAFRHRFVDLVALGTVADVTTLRGENRILVTHGLKALARAEKTGLRALMIRMGLMGQTLDAESISWKLGPRLNAAGRMEDADLAYRLLTTKDPDEAERLALELEALAERTREETARVTTDATADALSPEHEGRRVLVLARERWGKGVIGIAAARIAETFRRPTILLSYDADHDSYHGSARSHADFNLHAALHHCEELLDRWGGHSLSAGVSLKSANLDAFRAMIDAYAADYVAAEPPAPTLDVDAELPDGAALTFDLMDWLGRLAPFGRDNPEPVLVSRGALVLEARRVGKDNNTLTMSVRLPGTTNPLKGVWFRNGAWADRLTMGDNVDIAFTPKVSEWRGSLRLELMFKDIKPSA